MVIYNISTQSVPLILPWLTLCCISYMFSWCLLSSWENSSYCRLGFSLNLMPLLGLTLMGLTTLLDLLSSDSCLAHLLVIFHCDHL